MRRTGLLALILLAACQTGGGVKDITGTFPVLIGGSVPDGSGLDICADYGRTAGCAGQRYGFQYSNGQHMVRVTRHQGMDFRASAGTTVIAAAAGKIVQVRPDHECAGGNVTIETAIRIDNPRRPGYLREVYVNHIHITPLPEIRTGMVVAAGTPLGTIIPANRDRPCYGAVAHVHLQANLALFGAAGQHIDPNLFWADGPGQVTCFDPSAPPPDDKIVAPLMCE